MAKQISWRSAAAFALCACSLAGCGDGAASKSAQTGAGETLRIAMSGSTDDPRMVRRRAAYRDYLAKASGLPVKLYESADYNGTIQALSSGQVDIATVAGGSYANVDAQVGDKVAPILTNRQPEGDMGYYSALLVRADSPYRSIQDLRGKTLGYVDFNSTSGYLYPRAKMRDQGFDPDTYFGKTTFAGGHTQAVMALANGQFDATLVQMGNGDPVHGFTTGALYTMARRGMVNVEDFRVVWTVGPIPNAAIVVRTDRDQRDIDLVRGAMAALPFDDPELWTDIGQPDGSTFTAVDKRHYAEVIALRKDALARRRSGDQGTPP